MPGQCTITNLTPALVTFSGSATGAWTGPTPGAGTALVQCTHPVLGTRVVSQAVSRAIVGTLTFNGYRVGLSADLSSLIDGALAGVVYAYSKQTFINPANNARNPSLWCAPICDVTAISREYDGVALFTYMALIGPHHFLTASHISPSPGATAVWCDNAGNAYAGTVRSKAQVAGTDIAVCYVNDATSAEMTAYNALHPTSIPVTQPLSAATIAISAAAQIKPMVFLPSTTYAGGASALPLSSAVSTGLANLSRIPLMLCDRNHAISVMEIYTAPASRVYTDGNTYANEIEWIAPATASRSPWRSAGTASGDILFTATLAATGVATNAASNGNVLGAGYPILIGCTHGAVGAFQLFTPFASLYSAAGAGNITALMQSTAAAAGDPLSATYAAVTVSIAGYPTY